MLYKEWLNEWLDLYVKPSAKERTYTKYRQQVRKYLLPALGERDVNELSAVELQRFLASLIGRGLAPNTVNFIIALLKLSLRRGVALGTIERECSAALSCPQARTGKAACFTKSEQKKIERYIFEAREPCLFGVLLCLYTGLRIGELLALTWADVDLRRGTLTVTKSCHDGWENGRYKKILDSPKTQSSERVVPLPKQLLGYMKELKKSGGRFVVTGRGEYGAEIRSYQHKFAGLLKKLGIEHKCFHTLRHTFATRALEVGMDVKTLSEILGHRDPAITLRRYAHSLLEHKTEMMNKVGKLLD